MTTTIKIENISKQYRLGQVGTGTISHDLNRWWANLRGKEDPYSKVGQVNQRDQAAESEYVWALKDIDFEVEEGEVLGIIGANGAGKSTLLKIISRITSPTTGSIKAKGRIASLLEVGTGMHSEMTARENIYLNGAIMGMKRHEITRKFDDIIDFAGCRMYVDTPIKRFSSGMKVRLGFAVAAFLEPEILIVDEVLAVGDAEFQKRAIGKMKDISNNEGRTILFVSHNLKAVANLCSSTLVINVGKATQPMSTDSAINEYLAETVISTADLREVKHFGTGVIRVVNINASGSSGVAPVITGKGFAIKLTLEKNQKTMDEILLYFSIQVLDEHGSSIFLHHNRLNNIKFNINNIQESITFEAPIMPLLPGTYKIGYSIYDTFNRLIDSTDNRFTMHVEGGKVYETAELPPRTHSLLVIPGATWRLS